MQSLQVLSNAAPKFSNLIECLDGRCPGQDQNIPVERTEARDSVSAEEYNELLMANHILGAIWVLHAWLPITLWYTWRRPNIRAYRTVNPWYYTAWNFMWMSHYFVFGLPAIVWPFSYFGSQTVNNFYMLVNYYVGTIVGGGIALASAIFFIFALVDFTAVGNLLT